jgi:hypothetical protein
MNGGENKMVFGGFDFQLIAPGEGGPWWMV